MMLPGVTCLYVECFFLILTVRMRCIGVCLSFMSCALCSHLEIKSQFEYYLPSLDLSFPFVFFSLGILYLNKNAELSNALKNTTSFFPFFSSLFLIVWTSVWSVCMCVCVQWVIYSVIFIEPESQKDYCSLYSFIFFESLPSTTVFDIIFLYLIETCSCILICPVS